MYRKPTFDFRLRGGVHNYVVHMFMYSVAMYIGKCTVACTITCTLTIIEPYPTIPTPKILVPPTVHVRKNWPSPPMLSQFPSEIYHVKIDSIGDLILLTPSSLYMDTVGMYVVHSDHASTLTLP